jgi:hypothetical protein
MWLFASAEAENAVRDAVYRIMWHVTPFNERDDSWLRMTLGEVSGRELHPFLSTLTESEFGKTTLEEWLSWTNACKCTWQHFDEAPFPTSETSPGVSPTCQMHKTIEACAEFCERVDSEWASVADWYQLDWTPGEGRRRHR